MKICPQCRTPYTDSTIIYCLKDGSLLVDVVPSGFASKADTLAFPNAIPTTQAIAATEGEFVCPDKWLHEIAGSDKNNLSNAVFVAGCEPHYDLARKVPHIDFKVTIFNGSVYSISIASNIEGYINYCKQMLMGSMKIISNAAENVPHKGVGAFVVRLQVSREEADLITGSDRDGDWFGFDQLKVNVKGGDESSDVKPAWLNLPHSVLVNDWPKRIAALDTQHRNEVTLLKERIEVLESQVEQVKSERPLIEGNIKEVFFDKSFSMQSMEISQHNYDDFVFTMSIYIGNLGAETTIREFKLILMSYGHPYNGEKVSLEGVYVKRRSTQKEKLIDIESSNDEPLKHSRNGWLRFNVSTVQRVEHEPEEEMELVLCAIDKYGTSHKLISLPHTQWKENDRWEYPRIEDDGN